MSDTFEVKKINEVFYHVGCDPALAQEISEHFSFVTPNHQFMPAFKSGYWDGRIRLFNAGKQFLYCGLRKEFEHFCKIRNHKPKFEVTDSLLKEEEVASFIASLPLSASGKTIKSKAYQTTAVIHAMTHEKAILLSPTASGKSLMAYQICRAFQKFFPKDKCLVIVPNLGLINQLQGDFADYASTDKWDAEKETHSIFSGQEKESDKPVHLSTWQSIYNQPRPFFHKYKMVIVDEAHGCTADSLKRILENAINCSFRIGMTGTVQDAKCHKLMLEGLLGPVCEVTTTKKLMESKDVASLDITCLLLKYDNELCKYMRKCSYQQEIDFVIGHEKRNNFIISLVEKVSGNTLLLYQYVDKHGKVLYNALRKKHPTRPVFFVCGEVGGDERTDIRELVETHTNAIIVASYATFSTGMSIKNLHNIVFSSPYKSKIRLLQSIGRGLRISNTKSKVDIFDIADDFSVGEHKNYGLKHLTERMKIYVRQQFPYKLVKIPF